MKSMRTTLGRLAEASWARPLILFGLSRVWFACLLSFFAHYFTVDYSGRSELEKPDYWTAVTSGDGSWYSTIATNGYPRSITFNADGIAEKNEWAFYPLWPVLCRAFSSITGAPFWLVAPILALILGFAASYVLYRLCKNLGMSEPRTLLLLTFLFFSPLGVVFSLAYTESLALFLLSLALLLVSKKRYGLACGPIFLLAVTRPIGLALAIALALYFIFRLFGRESFEKSERWKLVGLTLFSGLSFGAWPTLAAVRFSDAEAYLTIQEAWRQYYTEPIAQWLLTASSENWLLALGFLIAFGLIGLSLRSRTNGETWPVLLQAWALGYLIFIALTVPGGNVVGGEVGLYPSTLRYALLALIPLLPLAPLLDRRVTPPLRVALISSVVVLNIALTILYFRYFVVMELPTLHYWL